MQKLLPIKILYPNHHHRSNSLCFSSWIKLIYYSNEVENFSSSLCSDFSLYPLHFFFQLVCASVMIFACQTKVSVISSTQNLQTQKSSVMLILPPAKKSLFLKKLITSFEKKCQMSFRSGKLFCKFKEFFKSSRPCMNLGWLICDVNLFHSHLKILLQEWLKVRCWLFAIYVGKPESHLLFEKSVPGTKKWLQRPETGIKDC